MSTRIAVDVTVENDEVIKAGHKPGIIQIGSATLFFREALWTGEPLTAMKALKEVLDSQIEDIESERGKPVAAPADPAPLTAATDYAIRTILEPGAFQVPAIPMAALDMSDPDIWCKEKYADGETCRRLSGHDGDHYYSPKGDLVVAVPISDDIPF